MTQLILTADRTLWPEDDCLFLGAWCLPPSDANIMPYPFAEDDSLYVAYQYLQTVYNRLFPQIAMHLNQLHGCHRSLRYWEIVAGYWFREYIEILYERYTCVKSAFKHHPKLSVKLMHSKDYLTPEDSLHFAKLYISDRYNLQLYTQVIDCLSDIDGTRLPQGTYQTSPGHNLDRKKQLIKWISLIFAKRSRLFINASYLPLKTLVKLAIRLGTIPSLDTPHFIFKATSRNEVLRDILQNLSTEDEFEEMIAATLPQNLPKIYLENFSALQKKIKRFYPVKPVTTILTANSFAVNEGFKTWAAEQIESYNAQLVIAQHGGNYGVARWNSSEDYETHIADYYLTYGWNDVHKQNIVPFIANRITHQASIPYKQTGTIMWVMCSFPRYAYTMYSVPVAGQFHDYLGDQVAFLNALNTECLSLIRCRLYPHEYGWSDKEYYLKHYPNLQFDQRKGSMLEALKSTRLFVCSYNATAHLEAMVANIPCILYWEPKHWQLRPEAQELHAKLETHGILHRSPESAARKVNEVFHNPLSWWMQEDIQEVRKQFCDTYARTHKNSDDMWIELIANIDNRTLQASHVY